MCLAPGKNRKPSAKLLWEQIFPSLPSRQCSVEPGAWEMEPATNQLRDSSVSLTRFLVSFGAPAGFGELLRHLVLPFSCSLFVQN